MKLNKHWRCAVASIRGNILPLVVLWLAAAGLVVAYYASPRVAALLEPVKAWQTEKGFLAAAANRAFFCGVLPGVFLAAMKSIRPPRLALTVLAYALWGAAWGVLADVFFTCLSGWFGCGRSAAVLAKKLLADQFVWTPFFCAPLNALFFTWVAGGFKPLDAVETVKEKYFTVLFANWLVWPPVMLAVYAFPLPLQVQLVGFAGAFWMLAALAAGAKGDENR